MKDNLYYVFNRLSGRYGEPFGCASDSLAVRNVRSAFQRSQIDVSDFDLCRFGSYDLETGKCETCDIVRIDISHDLTIRDVEKELEKNV